MSHRQDLKRHPSLKKTKIDAIITMNEITKNCYPRNQSFQTIRYSYICKQTCIGVQDFFREHFSLRTSPRRLIFIKTQV